MAAITGDPCDPLFQVRLYIGDTDESLVSDEVIDFALRNNSNNVKPAAIETLKYALSYLSNQTYHEVGDVLIDYNKLYDQAAKQLDRLIRDPAFNGEIGIIFGGVSVAEKLRVTSNSDFVGSPITAGDSLK